MSEKILKEKIVLSLSKNYLAHWNVFDALREIYQNAFDREAEANEATLINYVSDISESVTLNIGNELTVLSRNTLILGETSKRDSKISIGKFGEGYKLALLVLLRNNIKVEISTADELWIAKLEYNKQFKTKMLTIYVYESKKRPSLVFRITGIPSKVYHAYTQHNLRLQSELKSKKVNRCEILLDKRNKGRIYVGDLFVCEHPGRVLYGYNFDPSVFKLGRDRNIIDGFNLNWEAGRALIQLKIEDAEMVDNVVDNISEADDVSHLKHFTRTTSIITKKLWNKFKEEFPNSIPVSSSCEIKDLQEKYKGIQCVVINEKVSGIITGSKEYRDAINSYELKPKKLTPEEIVNMFYENYSDELSDVGKEKFAELIMAEAITWKSI